MHPNIYSSTIYNSQVLKATQVPISKWMDQKTMAHLHNGILCTRKKAGASTLCDFMDGTGEHYGKWKKPGSERQIPYDLTFYWHLINKTNMEAKYDIEIGNNLAVTRRERGGDIVVKRWMFYRNNDEGHMDNNKAGWKQGREVMREGVGGGEGKKLCLHNNKKC